jgi:tetratricopeptide (TPR) repeat protein
VEIGSAIRIGLGLAGIIGVLAFLVLTIKRADDPARMAFKWVLTALVLGALFGLVGPIVDKGGYGGAFVGIPATAVCGLVLAIIWRHTISGLIADPFASLYNGGTDAPDPHPTYSTARAHQKQGRYTEAVQEIRQQLQRFPTDVEGHLLLAEIQAQNLKDLPGAEITIERFISQPGHHPKNVVFALYSMADWHLAVTGDREAAKLWLEKIPELLPDSEYALGAAQRIAHLDSPDIELLDPKKYALPPGEQSVGLMSDSSSLRAAEVDYNEVASKYVRHLDVHPLDTDIREKLAALYADQYGRLDLAVDQLEQMIQQPNQPAKNIVRWLNMMTDWEVRCGGDYESAKATLQRIIDRHPEGAAAEVARNRLSLLKLEFKAIEKNESVKLGTYEQNIGLKGSYRAGPRK